MRYERASLEVWAPSAPRCDLINDRVYYTLCANRPSSGVVLFFGREREKERTARDEETAPPPSPTPFCCCGQSPPSRVSRIYPVFAVETREPVPGRFRPFRVVYVHLRIRLRCRLLSEFGKRGEEDERRNAWLTVTRIRPCNNLSYDFPGLGLPFI